MGGTRFLRVWRGRRSNLTGMKRIRSEDGGFALESAILAAAWLVMIWLLIAAVRLHHSSLAAASAAAAAAHAAVAQDADLPAADAAAGIFTTGCAELGVTVTETDRSATAQAVCTRHAAQARGILGGAPTDSFERNQPPWPLSPD